MKVILKPTSYPELGEIIIEDCLLPIGRFEAPFNSCKSDAAARLAKRHARIFQEGEACYLVDLGSPNGTKVNGRSISKQLVQLHNGDKVCFAEQVCFAVAIPKEIRLTRSPAPASPIRLTLSPLRNDTGLASIVVERFPFLIGKESAVFSKYKKSFPDKIKYISRRHALFYLKDDALHIEDLGSTNGTFVSKIRVMEDAVLLKDGDTVSFGGDYFAYSAKLERDAKASSVQEPGTILVSKADSFLNVFCQQDDVKDAADLPVARKTDELTGEPGQAEDARGQTVRPRFAFLNKSRVFLTELKEAVAEEKPASSRRIWLVIGVGTLLLLLVFGLYLKESPEREIKSLLSKGQYAASAALANQYLQEYPEDERLSTLATEAVLKSFAAEWLKKIANQEFAAASSLLASARDLSRFNSDALKILEIMNWIVDLEKFVTGRGGTDTPIMIFNHEVEMEALLEWWDRDATGHHRLMVRTLRYVPSFEGIYSQTFSHLRMLRSEKSVYLMAIERLKETIRDKLDTDRAGDLTEIFKDFKEKYPKIGGLERLEEDLENYLEAQEIIREKDLAEISRLGNELKFWTPPFQERVARLLDTALPPPEIITAYQEATEAWVAGESDRAIAILNPLTQEIWGEVARRKLERYKKVVEEFEVLRTEHKDNDYGERLLVFYNSLNPDEDGFFLHTLEADFQLHKEEALKHAKDSFEIVQQRWNRYQENGGIGGVLRLEAVVSDAFRQQAQLLAEAHDRIGRGIRTYDLLRLDYPARWKSLYDAVSAEIKRQRQWLTDLNTVLEPALVKTKLRLLGESQEDSP